MTSCIHKRCVNSYLLKMAIFLLLSLLATISECAKNKTNHVKWDRVISSPWNKMNQMWLKSIKRQQEPQSMWPNVNPEAYMTSVEIIANRGYPVEVHSVTTDDGYILEIHRIPYGKNQNSSSAIKRQVVILQHGLLNTDAVWLIKPSDKALAYILADLGYDVWLGNARGNTYSRKHTTLDPTKQPYWKFSFNEMGEYDIPAVINYVLSKTGRSSLSYVGHSMGCAMFFIAMTYHPELNSKIDVMVALAPATANGHSRNSLPYQAPFANQILRAFLLTGGTVFQPVDSIQHNLQKRICGPNMFLRKTFCMNYVFTITSDSYDGVDLSLLPVIDGHFPAGTSVWTPVHYGQLYNTRQSFQKFDYNYGTSNRKNLQLYGQSTPPSYDLSKVTCPVHIFYGKNDKAVAPEDVAWLAARLGNLKELSSVADSKWNHGAHLYATTAKELVYDRIIALLPSTPL